MEWNSSIKDTPMRACMFGIVKPGISLLGIECERSLSSWQWRPVIGPCSLINSWDNDNTNWTSTLIPTTRDNGLDCTLTMGGGGGDLALVLQCTTDFVPLACNYITLLCPSQCNASLLTLIPVALGNGRTPPEVWLLLP
jgi:hypothetical protein